MTAIGIMTTAWAVGHVLVAAIMAFYNKAALPLANHLMVRYAPKWLKLLDLRIQGWLALPAWISWRLDDMAVSALERTANKYRAANDRKANQLLIEAEDYNARYFETINSK